ncbi:cytochrome b/b6 domain-containing protein [Pseudomonas sp. Z1-12]|uniref:cytochrome b/b6 domain-containing protein n=1 Tax=Pseudomonas sp. Z1-12 TaxID=2817408 RepID=UPI003DA7D027
MPDHPPAPRLSALKLTVSIALGLWLGFLAIVLTGWLLSRFLFDEQLAPVAAAVHQLAQPPVVQPAPEPPAPMFEQYQQNLQRNEQRQALDQARSNPRNLSNPKCQFWLQQDQNAPSEKSRANVLQFCE